MIDQRRRCSRCNGATARDEDGDHCINCGHVAYRADMPLLYGLDVASRDIALLRAEEAQRTIRRPGVGVERHTSPWRRKAGWLDTEGWD